MSELRNRLEYVREAYGIKTLKELHQRLGGKPTYEAMRTYHKEDSPVNPPVSYIDRYGRVFGVNLTWLVRGGSVIWEKEAGG